MVDETKFRCPVCSSGTSADAADFHREIPSCKNCGSTVRHRQLVSALQFVIAGQTGSDRSEVKPRVLGMSDHPLISRWCEEAGLDYRNTFFDENPMLDITDPSPAFRDSADILISSDVLEHVMYPISEALKGMYDCLSPRGHLVLTCPYVHRGPSVEHFPWMRSYRVTGSGDVVGKDMHGREEVLNDPVFHGGPGNTLEMRLLGLSVITHELKSVGFESITVLDEPVPDLGIFPTDRMGVIVCERGAAE